MPSHVDIEKWVRYGKGKTYQFYVTDLDLLEVLKESLPPKFEPYSLIGVYREKREGDSKQSSIETPIEDFLELRAQGIWKFFINSLSISDTLEIKEVTHIDRLLATHGLPVLQHGLITNRVGWNVSSIGIVDKIRHTENRTIISHNDYNEVFDSFKSGLKKIFSYTTIKRLPDGRKEELKSVFMSEQFAHHCISGKIHTNVTSGSRLNK